IFFNSRKSSGAQKRSLEYIFLENETWGAVEKRNEEHWLMWDAGGSESQIFADASRVYVDLSPILRQTVKSQNSMNGEFDSWVWLDGSSRGN
ncbi:MAG TPA: hypothetical protein VN670_09015, partial [Acidobacteriaceae bacterium]|nr:hypothetical protein [Acidobacteriaceae bacterium]